MLSGLVSQRPAGRRLRRQTLEDGARSLTDSAKRATPGRRRKIRRATTYTISDRGGETRARVGINIGSKRNKAPHAVWIIKGTRLRATKNGANRGRIKGDDFFTRAIRRGRAAAIDKMQESLNQQVE